MTHLTAGKLIEELAKLPPETPITIWADHGQEGMKATTWGIKYVATDDFENFMFDPCDTADEVDDDPEVPRTPIFEIGSP